MDIYEDEAAELGPVTAALNRPIGDDLLTHMLT
jgi:hypothetical protein